VKPVDPLPKKCSFEQCQNLVHLVEFYVPTI
jgi:hypothetical protein